MSEFTWGGEYHPLVDADTVSSEQWAEYLFFNDNVAGTMIEWWCHNASSYWFLAERNTLTDEVIRCMTLAAYLEE